MSPAPRPAHEDQRVETLRRLLILDTPSEAAFDRLTETAASVLGVPIAAINLIDADRVWFKSSVGPEQRQGSREAAFCSHVIMGDSTLVVPDAMNDERFRENPQVVDGGIRFYAGRPIIASNGHVLGSFCVKDHRPRDLTDTQLQFLTNMAGVAAHMIELRCAAERESEQRALAEQREHQIARTESILARVGRMARIGGWELDIETMSVTWSDEVHRIHDLEPGKQPSFEEAISFYAPEVRADIAEMVQQAIDHGVPWDLELPFVTALGRTLTVRAIGEPEWRDGKVVRLFGVLQDITERKRATSELKRTRQRLNLALAAAQVGLWDWDLGSDEVYLNDQWSTMLGFEAGELPMELGTWESLCNPDDLRRTREELERHIAGQTPRHVCELRMRCKDGSWKWILSIGEVVEHDEQGRPIRMVGVHIDIDDQKRVQAELERARAGAEAASEAKSGFLANMSHELRTPLTSIIGFSDILSDTQTPPEEMRKSVEIISNNARHLLTLISDILDLSKIESNHVELEPVPCRPERFGKDLEAMLATAARNKGIAFEVEIERPIASVVLLDQVRVRQILLNLASNAVKFTAEGGVRVVLSCRPNPTGTAAFVVEVHDTGIGMDEQCLARIFKPFIQGEVSSTRQYGGTGLGLSISNALAQMMGGRIEVRSEAGRGSCFTLSIPLEHEHFEMRQMPPPRGDGRGSADLSPRRPDLTGARVLVVEDGADNQRLIQTYLQLDGATVIIAADGRAGVDAVNAVIDTPSAFDLVLMDMQMPVLDGYGATRELRAAGYDRPIVALTAYATSGDRARCLEAGCDDFLSKPVSREDLARTCAEWIRDWRRRAA